MFRTPHGLDAGTHEQEYDPVSDKINDMLEDFMHSREVQEFVSYGIWGCDQLIDDIETAVRIATGSDSWNYPVDGDLKALRGAIEAYVDNPKRGE